jgi:hypothetical protein
MLRLFSREGAVFDGMAKPSQRQFHRAFSKTVSTVIIIIIIIILWSSHIDEEEKQVRMYERVSKLTQQWSFIFVPPYIFGWYCMCVGKVGVPVGKVSVRLQFIANLSHRQDSV